MTPPNQDLNAPLRLLHTSDWHLGARLSQASRHDEHRAFLEWLLEALRAHRVQVLLISGDVFDTPIPPAEAEQLYYSFLARASALPDLLQVVVVGGNHDSAARIDAPEHALRPLKVHTVGGLTPRHDRARCLCPVRDPASPDTTRCVVLAVPFIHEFHLGVRAARVSDDDHRASLQQAFAALYRDLADEASQRWPGVPLVATGHLTAAGTTRGDFQSFVHGWRGGDDNLPLSTFDPRLDYVALGHIHRPFAVDASAPHPRIWYAGSPIPLRFDEVMWEQRALLVEVRGHGVPVAVNPLLVPRHRVMIKLEGPPDVVEARLREVSQAMADSPGEPTPLISIDAHVHSPQATLGAHLNLVLSQLAPQQRPLVVGMRQTRVGLTPRDLPDDPAPLSLHQLSPEDVFARLHQARMRQDPPDDLLDAFRSLLLSDPTHNTPYDAFMKIHRLTIHNVNALYGVHAIDFDGALSLAPIFLIRGPTGAGKTTLLDAISLALYGKTPRLLDSRNDDSSPEHVMSTGTGECSVELEFSRVQGGARVRFRAAWSCQRAHRKPDGAIQKPKRRLERLQPDGAWATLCDGAAVRAAEVAFDEALDSLSIHDFHRTVILPQGDFSAFLRASHTDRAKILERLTNSSLYAEIGRRAAARFKDVRAQYEAHEARCRAARVPTDADLDALTAQIAAAHADAGAAQARLLSAQALRAAAAAAHASTAAAAHASARAASARAAYDAHQPSRDLLALDARCQPAAQALKDLDKARADLRSLDDKRKGAQTERDALDADLTTLQRDHAAAHTAAHTAQAAYKALSDQLPAARAAATQRALATQRGQAAQAAADDASTSLLRAQRAQQAAAKQAATLAQSLDTAQATAATLSDAAPLLPLLPDLTTARALIDSQHKPLQKRQSDLNAAQNAATQHAQAVATLQGGLQPLQAALDAATHRHIAALATQRDLLATLSAADTSSARDALYTERNKTQRALSSTERAITLSAQRDALDQRAATSRADLATLDARAPSLRVRADALEAERADLQSRRDAFKLAVEQADLRARLSHDQPCPVCGSLDHPFAASPHPTPSATPDADPSTLLAAAERDLRANQKALTAAQSDLKADTLQRANLTKDLTALSAQRDALSQDLPADASPDALRASLSTLRASLQSLDDRDRALASAQAALSDAQAALSAAQSAHQAQVTKVQQAQAALSAAQATATSHAAYISDALVAIRDPRAPSDAPPPALSDLPTLRASLEQDLLRAQALTHAQAEAAALSDKHATAQATLAAAQAELDAQTLTHTLRADALRAAHADLATAHAAAAAFFDGQDPDAVERHAQATLAAAQATLATAQAALSDAQHARARLDGSLLELDEQRRDLSSHINLLRDQLSSTLQTLGLPSEDALRAVLLSPSDRLALEADDASLRASLHQAQATLQAAQDTHQRALSDLAPLLAPATPDPQHLPDLTSLDAAASACQQDASSALQRLGALTSERARALQARADHAADLEAFERSRPEFERWKRLNDLIGTRDGQAFRDFAQGITLTLVVTYANRWLITLTDRYHLRCDADPNSARPPQFAIEDTYQGSAMRPVSTLSGGESFVVSLALALGLADCAGVSMPIETLLLDEGFGTLDADAVQVVIDALSRLQSEKGVQLGVISHVEALQRQLPSQVRVERVAPGRSRVTVTDSLSAT